jgi:hypothetical protein
MANKSHVKIALSLDDRKKLVTFFQILMVVDKQVKTKKAAKKGSSKSKEDKITCKHISYIGSTKDSQLFIVCKAPKNKTGALSLLNNSLILNGIVWTCFIEGRQHARYDYSYVTQPHVYH